MGSSGSSLAAEFLREYLAGADAACPGCGYNLRGLTTQSCPECNERLVLRVGLEEPKLRLWIAGLVGLAAGSGFNLLLLTYAAIMVVTEGRNGLPWAFIGHNLVGVLVTGGLLGAWLSRRAPIRRLPIRSRAWLVAACWGLALANVTIFAVLIR